MKKLILPVIAIVSLLALTGMALAAKPAGNNAGAQKVAWNLSAAVMPVPPYGSSDILGSDTASKLIVNQPNGKVQAMVTGVMNGLLPDTTYTVYLSNPYTPYVSTGWNIVGSWVFRAEYYGGIYDHDVVINSQTGNTFSGTGGYPAGCVAISSCSVTETITGTIDPVTGAITMHIAYDSSGYTADVVASVASDGADKWNLG